MNTVIKVSIIITDKKQEKVLLIKEQVEKANAPAWNFIKGTYDNPKESIFEAAQRECLEETSVNVILHNLVGVYTFCKNNNVRVQFCFTATIRAGTPHVAKKGKQELLNENIIELRWFSKDEVASMVSSDFVSFKTHLILNEWINGKNYPLECCKYHFLK